MLSSEFIRSYTTSQRSSNPFEKQCYIFDEGISIVEGEIRKAFRNKGKTIEEIDEIIKKEIETPNDDIILKYELDIDFESLLEKLKI